MADIKTLTIGRHVCVMSAEDVKEILMQHVRDRIAGPKPRVKFINGDSRLEWHHVTDSMGEVCDGTRHGCTVTIYSEAT